MKTSNLETNAREYIASLRHELRAANAGARDALLIEISEEFRGMGYSQVDDRILELGDPASLASGAREGRPATVWQPVRSAAYRWTAVALLLLGGSILPVVGWILGVVLRALDRSVSVRRKVVEALVFPVIIAGIALT